MEVGEKRKAAPAGDAKPAEKDATAPAKGDAKGDVGEKKPAAAGAVKKVAKTSGAAGKAASGKAKAPKKAGVEQPDDTYDDEVFDLSKMMKLESEYVAKLTPEQMRRYEYYRRADLKKEKLKKLLTSLNLIPSSMAPSDPFIIAVKGLAKVFVGEVVETALDVQKQWGESGPLHPKHLREAHRRMLRDGLIPQVRDRPAFPFVP